MLHGRLLAGLAARAVEREEHDPALRIARLTVDMFRFPPMTPYTVTTEVTRDGHRVRAVSVSIVAGGVEVARAAALMLRTGEHPEASVWRTPNWDAPPPEEVPPPDGQVLTSGWELRLMSEGGFWTADRKRVWTRDSWQLVEGEELTPAVRAALAADLPNPLANSGVEGLQFINADLTMFLARPPSTEWIGLEVTDHIGHDGIAIGSCTLYDVDGPIGSSTVCAITNTSTLSN
jgi:acyl-CoA thioesterase